MIFSIARWGVRFASSAQSAGEKGYHPIVRAKIRWLCFHYSRIPDFRTHDSSGKRTLVSSFDVVCLFLSFLPVALVCRSPPGYVSPLYCEGKCSMPHAKFRLCSEKNLHPEG